MDFIKVFMPLVFIALMIFSFIDWTVKSYEYKNQYVNGILVVIMILGHPLYFVDVILYTLLKGVYYKFYLGGEKCK